MSAPLAEGRIVLVSNVAEFSRELQRAVQQAAQRAADDANDALRRIGQGVRPVPPVPVPPPEAQRRYQGIAAGLRSIAAAGAGLAAGGAVIGFFKDSIGAASDLAETVNKSNVIFGDNAGAIEEWANGAAQSVGLSKQAALEAAAGFGDMFTQIGIGGDAAADMSKQIVTMSADFGSFNNLPTAEVADMISAAFRGEFDSLQRVVPNINAARVEQEALALSHKKTAKELTSAEKAQAVMTILQKDGARAAGDFARTSDGLANSQKIAAAQFEDAKAKLGQSLLPVMQQFTKLLSTVLIPALSALIGFVQRNGRVLALLGATILTVVVAHKAWATWQRINMGLTARQFIALQRFRLQLLLINRWQRLVAISTTIWTKAQRIFNLVFRQSPIGRLIVILTLLVGAVVLAYKRSETFREIVTKAWQSIKAVVFPIVQALRAIITTVFNAIKSVITTIMGVVQSVISTRWTAIKTVITTIINAIKTVITTVFNVIKTTITTIFNAIKTYITTVFNAYKTIITTAVNAIKSVVTTVFNAIKSLITTVLNAVRSTVTTVWNAIRTIVTTAVNAIRNAVTTAFNAIRNTITTVLNAVAGVVRTILGTVKDVFTNVWNAIRTAVTTAINAVKSAVTTALNAILSGARTILGGVAGVFTSVWNTVKSGVTAAWTAIKGLVSNGISAVVTTIQGLPGKIGALAGSMLSAGKNLISALFNGLRNAGGAIASLAGDVGKAIVNSVINFLNGILPHEIKIGVHKGPINFDVRVPLFPNIPNLADGGLVPGNGAPTADDQLIAASSGEFVVNAAATRRHRQLLEAINANRPLAVAGGANKSVTVNQNYYGPTTSQEKRRETEWTLRYAPM